MNRSTVSMVLGVISAMAIASIAMAQTPSVNLIGSTTGTASAPTSSIASTSTSSSVFYSNTSSALVAMPPSAYSAVSITASTSQPWVSLYRQYPAIILNVNSQGRALMRGVVESIGTSTLNVRSWGGLWSVSLGSTTRMQRSQSLSTVQVGDIVGVEGSVATATPLTIAASFVRDWTRK